jgi:GT2 family glycosyltransferase
MFRADAQVAIVIVTYNGRALLERFFGTVVNAATVARTPTAVYVVDNASDDDSVAWLRERFPAVRVIASRTNLRWGPGNNLGARMAAAEHPNLRWLVFLNNDVAVEPDFVDGIVAVPDDPAIGIAGVRARFWYPALVLRLALGDGVSPQTTTGSLAVTLANLGDERSARVWCDAPALAEGGLVVAGPTTLQVPVDAGRAGAVTLAVRHRCDDEARMLLRVESRAGQKTCALGFNETRTLTIPFGADDSQPVINNAGSFIDARAGECGDIGINEVDAGRYDHGRYVDAICGVAMAVRAPVFLRLRGFDPAYQLYYEDSDLCARAARLGYRCWYNPCVTIRHLHSASSVERSPQWHEFVRASGALFRKRFAGDARLDAFCAGRSLCQ